MVLKEEIAREQYYCMYKITTQTLLTLTCYKNVSIKYTLLLRLITDHRCTSYKNNKMHNFKVFVCSLFFLIKMWC